MQRHRHRTVLTLCVLVVAALDAAGAAEIYRCDERDGVVFSDVPCSESAEIHRSARGISVVRPAETLTAVAERNRAYLADRRSRIAERRARAADLRNRAERLRDDSDTAPDPEPGLPLWAPATLQPAAPAASRRRAPDPRIRELQRSETRDSIRDLRRSLRSRTGGKPIVAPRERRYQ